MPDWALKPLEAFTEHIVELREVISLSKDGIHGLTVMPRFVRVAKLPQESLDKSLAVADKAQSEIDTDFALLHEMSTITLWSSLEAMIKSFLALWLENEKSALNSKGVENLKIRLGEYLQLSGTERCEYILELLYREVRAPLQKGISGFETLLGVFGLSGAFDKDLKKDVFELHNVRNLLVHRRGIADLKFLEACPWLRTEAGKKHRVSNDDFSRYVHAVTEYVITVNDRVAIFFGEEPVG